VSNKLLAGALQFIKDKQAAKDVEKLSSQFCNAHRDGSSGRGRQTRQSIPLRRIGDAAEVAVVAVFLASEDSSYMTGSEVFVDGGYAQV